MDDFICPRPSSTTATGSGRSRWTTPPRTSKFYCPECLVVAVGEQGLHHGDRGAILETTNPLSVHWQAHVLYLMEWEKSAEDRLVENLKLVLLNIEETTMDNDDLSS